ncbi:MAG: 3-phosphoshikimate 1-carboxyvinyltransferase [Candidatus Gastranaerophilales bacterium]|nr:3-phosphoshikimate 1-carboxyvinyltransferase [Candidatus Gastranaerophilales bacterium]
MDITIEKRKTPLKGVIEIPSDKSISHRAAMFSALTGGRVKISNFSKGADCHSSLNIVKKLGCKVDFLDDKTVIVDASKALNAPDAVLDCGNSGTTMRLMSGILAGQSFNSELVGDVSLSKRPMKRVISPLELMGAKLEHKDYKAPLKIQGQKLNGVDYVSQLSSAQVKSCVLLAGLFSEGVTSFVEPFKSRNHTELMLKYLGADIKVDGNKVSIKKSKLQAKDISICGDISSAAFFMVAASIVPDSDITLINVGVNETRSGIIDALIQMNADIQVLNEREISGEKVADIRVRYSNLKATTIEGAIIPRLIDEIPVLAVAATQAEGTTVIKDAQDLRNKEADRIKCVSDELKKLGADVEETPDGFLIKGKSSLSGDSTHECYHDHRIAMSLYVAGLIAETPITVNEFQWVDISFPEFLDLMSDI